MNTLRLSHSTHVLMLAATCLFLVAEVRADLVVWQASSGLKPDQIGIPYSLVDTASNDPILSSGVLTLDTSLDNELMVYSMTGSTLAMPAAPVIEFNMRMVSQSTSFPLLRTGAAVGITTQNSVGNVVYIGIDEVFFLTSGGLQGPTASIDTDSSFHDYRIEVAGLSSGSAISLFQDDSLVLSHVLVTDSPNYGNEERIFFGNNTSVAHGASEWLSFQHNAAAVPTPGNMNCDGNVDIDDVVLFVEAVLDPVAFDAAHPDCDSSHADVNGDTEVNGGDVPGFVACVLNGGCP